MPIQWPLAKTPTGEYVKIEDAPRGETYLCPECSNLFVARRGAKVRWHFAHRPGAICTGEGSRHSVAKHLIASFLQNPLVIPLFCSCSGMATKQYRVRPSEVEVERQIGQFRVDVACKLNHHPTYIEVVDSHLNTEQKTNELGDNTVEVKIRDLSDSEVFMGDEIKLRLVKALGHHLARYIPTEHAFYHTWDSECWKCKQPQKRVMLCGDLWPESVPEALLPELRRHGNLQQRRTTDVPSGYIANICSSCHSVQGGWFINEEFIDLASGSPEKVSTHLWLGKDR